VECCEQAFTLAWLAASTRTGTAPPCPTALPRLWSRRCRGSRIAERLALGAPKPEPTSPPAPAMTALWSPRPTTPFCPCAKSRCCSMPTILTHLHHHGRKTERGYRVEHFATAFRHDLPNFPLASVQACARNTIRTGSVESARLHGWRGRPRTGPAAGLETCSGGGKPKISR